MTLLTHARSLAALALVVLLVALLAIGVVIYTVGLAAVAKVKGRGRR